MKVLLVFISLLLVSSVYTQIDCKPYVPTEVGTKWEITNFSAKDKELGKVAYELMSKTVSGDDLNFSIKAISFDDKGKETYINVYDAYCRDGKFEFDMSYMIDGGAMEAYQEMDVEVDASEYEIPDLDAPAGTRINDGTLTVSVGQSGMTMFKMTVNVTDRKVEARENVSTPAGTFSCVKLSQSVKTWMVVKIEASSTEWYAHEVGMVRSESYNKKGKLTGYTILTSFTAP